MKIVRLILLSLFLCGYATAEPLLFVTEPFPPFNFEDHGKASGAVPEIVSAVCERIGAECRISVMPWRRALLMAEKGEAYGIFCLSKIPERDAKFYLGSPVVSSAYFLFVRSSNKLVYKSPADLVGYTIGAYGPSGTLRAAEDLARNVPG